MTTSQIISFLLLLGAQSTPRLVADIAALIHGNPRSPGESDTDYAARMNQQVAALDAQIQAENAKIQG